MYKTDENDNGVHYYLVYYDRKSKSYHAVQLTHLYIKDKNRFKLVEKGFILVEKFKEFDVPSGVRDIVYTTNVNGTKIDIRDKKNIVKIFSRFISKHQSDRIKKFLCKKKT